MAQLTVNQRAWVHALRSGEYKQVKAKLKAVRTPQGDAADLTSEASKKYPIGHCCLGVGIDVLHPESWDSFEGVESDFEEGNYVGGYQSSLAQSGEELLGTDMLDALGIDSKFQDELSSLNDYGCTFKGIASYIEWSITAEPTEVKRAEVRTYWIKAKEARDKMRFRR